LRNGESTTSPDAAIPNRHAAGPLGIRRIRMPSKTRSLWNYLKAQNDHSGRKIKSVVPVENALIEPPVDGTIAAFARRSDRKVWPDFSGMCRAF
jgi:hypothetical protein